MKLHLYDPSQDEVYTKLSKSSNTLCGLPVGGTSGVVTAKNYMNPYYTMEEGVRLFPAHLTHPGMTTLRTTFADRTIWSKWDGFWEAELRETDFHLCPRCAEHPDFALMVLAEV